MPDQTINVYNSRALNTGQAVSLASLTSSNDGVLTPTSGRVVLVVSSSTTSNVTIKAGAGAVRSGLGDLTVSLNNNTAVVPLETARFKAKIGSDKGKIRVKVSAATSAYAIGV
jgi:3-oxoacyl-(acyl-carrier-protein) synthase